MKKNNKGFMLVEAVISGTIVLTSMVMLYATFNRLYNLYTEKNNYYNIDAVYATEKMINHLMEDNFSNFINNTFENNNYSILISDTTCHGEDFCNNLKNLYNVNKMIIAEYDKTTLEQQVKADSTLNQSFKDYIDFVIGYYGVSNSDTKYSYIVLTEIKDENDYYYANLGIG